MKAIISERAIGTWLRKECTNRGYKIIKLNPADYTGIPDRMILTTDGRTLYVELKSQGATLRPTQNAWKEWLIVHKHSYMVIDHVDDVNVDSILAFLCGGVQNI